MNWRWRNGDSGVHLVYFSVKMVERPDISRGSSLAVLAGLHDRTFLLSAITPLRPRQCQSNIVESSIICISESKISFKLRSSPVLHSYCFNQLDHVDEQIDCLSSAHVLRSLASYTHFVA